MQQAIIFTGRRKGIEHYQLLLDKRYISTQYRGEKMDGDHTHFLDDVAKMFAEEIVESRLTFKVGVFKGSIIEENGQRAQVEKLDEPTINYLSQQVLARTLNASEGRAEVIPFMKK